MLGSSTWVCMVPVPSVPPTEEQAPPAKLPAGPGAPGVRQWDAEVSSSLGLSFIYLNVVFIVLE